MLSHEGFWVTFSFKSISSEVTKIDSCKVIIPLGKINGAFKTRYKWVDIATEFLVPIGLYSLPLAQSFFQIQKVPG